MCDICPYLYDCVHTHSHESMHACIYQHLETRGLILVSSSIAKAGFKILVLHSQALGFSVCIHLSF